MQKPWRQTGTLASDRLRTCSISRCFCLARVNYQKQQKICTAHQPVVATKPHRAGPGSPPATFGCAGHYRAVSAKYCICL